MKKLVLGLFALSAFVPVAQASALPVEGSVYCVAYLWGDDFGSGAELKCANQEQPTVLSKPLIGGGSDEKFLMQAVSKKLSSEFHFVNLNATIVSR